MRETNRHRAPHGQADSSAPPELAAVERLLDRLGAHERSQAPFGMEERVASGSGPVSRLLGELAGAESAMADPGLEARVFAETHALAGRLPGAAEAPEGLEDRVFQATRSVIAGGAAGQRAASAPSVVMRIGRWSARLAAVLALGGGVWLAWTSLRGGTDAPGSGEGTLSPEVAAAEQDPELSFEEFDVVLESHLAFMKTVEYTPADVDVLSEDWCTSCELIEIEQEMAS